MEAEIRKASAAISGARKAVLTTVIMANDPGAVLRAGSRKAEVLALARIP